MFRSPLFNSELKPVDYGEVVAVEHFNIDGVIDARGMRGTRMSDIKITVVLNGGQKIATRPRADGTFRILDVPPGIHFLDTFALGYTFPPITLKLLTNGKLQAEYAEDPDELPATNPLRLRPVSTAEYFEARAAASPMAMLKNPMVLMVLMTVLMAWGMPKMIENMDPEELKMMQERMGSQPTMQDILSGKATADAAAAAKPKTGAERRAEQRAT